MAPPGSLPGMMALAISPAINPNIIHPSIAIILCSFELCIKIGAEKGSVPFSVRSKLRREIKQVANHDAKNTLS
jgi:hypothetical protein